MKYRKLPIEQRLEEIAAREGTDAAIRARESLFLNSATQEGFQFVTLILRDRERLLWDALRACHQPDVITRLVGALSEIQSIRASLAALVPAEQRSAIDWFDDAEEEYISPLDKGRK